MERKYTASEVVTAIYRACLRADPDRGGLEERTEFLLRGGRVEDLLASFLSSPQFAATQVVALKDLERLPASIVQSEVADTDLAALWRHIAIQWAQLGVEDPYWSVASTEEYRSHNMSHQEVVDRFYASGKSDLDRLLAYLGRNGLALPSGGICVDFGCGLGRVTLWLAQHCEKVIACDVSDAHLALARRNLAERGVDNVEFVHIADMADLKRLHGADFFHSIIVLQHNPPPIIRAILREAFAGLRPSGAAFFQVPTLGSGYSWDLASYWENPPPIDRFEMHMLPQNVIFDLAYRAGCTALEVQPDSCTGIPHWVSNSFLFRKV